MVVDYSSTTSIRQAIAGSQAVIIALGGTDILAPTEKILQTMTQFGPHKVEVITGFGSDAELRRHLPFAQRIAFMGMTFFYAAALKIMSQQVELVRQTDLDWLNVQPPWLTFEAPTYSYKYGDDANSTVYSRLSRADLANFMISRLKQAQLGQQSVNIVGPKTKN
ncbi:hypothetical protein D3C72_1597580 [compost metagenome]